MGGRVAGAAGAKVGRSSKFIGAILGKGGRSAIGARGGGGGGGGGTGGGGGGGACGGGTIGATSAMPGAPITPGIPGRPCILVGAAGLAPSGPAAAAAAAPQLHWHPPVPPAGQITVPLALTASSLVASIVGDVASIRQRLTRHALKPFIATSSGAETGPTRSGGGASLSKPLSFLP